jgi:two-component system, chemotaxis family, chemotaxis protein CheY
MAKSCQSLRKSTMPHTILVVDDHPHYLATVCKMLVQQIPQVAVSSATDGSAALNLIQQQAFDLLILDYQLQTTTGTDLVRQLRARAAGAGRPLPPVVMMSSQPDVAIFARALGIAAFLAKPLLSEHIETTIIPLLQRPGVDATVRRPLLWRVEVAQPAPRTRRSRPTG